MAIVVAMLCAAAVVSATVGGTLNKPTSPSCTAAAAEQLPKSLVDSVNAIEAKRNIATATSSAFVTDLMSRPLPGGGTAEAFANFDPQYCGFDGNINDFGGFLTSTYVPQDYVVLIQDGRPTQVDPDGICISNTVPTARMVNRVIVMTLRCDRLYSNNTWMETNPRLQPLSSNGG